MGSMKSCSHRTFIKGSSTELNFYENFYYIMKRKEKVCFKNNLKKIEKLSLKRTDNNEKVVVIELHRKRKNLEKSENYFFKLNNSLPALNYSMKSRRIKWDHN